MKVYIVRHGQVPHNALGEYNTRDEDLTELGIKQVEELRDKIEEYWNYYTDIQYGRSENIKLFFERIYNFLDELKMRNYKSVLIVAKAFSGYFEGIQDGKFLNRGLKNCEIKEYEL